MTGHATIDEIANAAANPATNPEGNPTTSSEVNSEANPGVTKCEAHRLIDEGQALVRSLAARIHRSVPVRVDLEDLIAYGELGLAEAARDFDPDHGNRFSTFAYYRIQGAIYDGLAKMTWTSRSRYKRLRYEQMAEETLDSLAADGAAPQSPREGGRWFGRAAEKLAVVYLASGEDRGSGGVADSLEDREEAAPQLVLHREANEKLRQLIELLPHDEAKLVKMIYFEGYTLQEAGTRLGFSRSWASRMHARVLERLAGQLRRLDLHD